MKRKTKIDRTQVRSSVFSVAFCDKCHDVEKRTCDEEEKANVRVKECTYFDPVEVVYPMDDHGDAKKCENGGDHFDRKRAILTVDLHGKAFLCQ